MPMLYTAEPSTALLFINCEGAARRCSAGDLQAAPKQAAFVMWDVRVYG